MQISERYLISPVGKSKYGCGVVLPALLIGLPLVNWAVFGTVPMFGHAAPHITMLDSQPATSFALLFYLLLGLSCHFGYYFSEVDQLKDTSPLLTNLSLVAGLAFGIVSMFV
ncbi:hypothetical protein ACERK3_06105 [Phycisphaerales bacterium AB-hyl4]|uniref:Uncharacterized protein n=1 Tax=Natronomicrosphaera hydrolytica TaxID=3242702 RepID=A0ABV4U4V4_9BACT